MCRPHRADHNVDDHEHHHGRSTVAARRLLREQRDQWVFGSIEFSGVENQLDNALQHFTGDGSCSDGSPAVVTIVRAADATSAVAVCNGLGGPDTFTSATNLSSFGWVVPADAWFCQTPVLP